MFSGFLRLLAFVLLARRVTSSRAHVAEYGSHSIMDAVYMCARASTHAYVGERMESVWEGKEAAPFPFHRARQLCNRQQVVLISVHPIERSGTRFYSHRTCLCEFVQSLHFVDMLFQRGKARKVFRHRVQEFSKSLLVIFCLLSQECIF
jgi:hypothetical protein